MRKLGRDCMSGKGRNKEKNFKTKIKGQGSQRKSASMFLDFEKNLCGHSYTNLRRGDQSGSKRSKRVWGEKTKPGKGLR